MNLNLEEEQRVYLEEQRLRLIEEYLTGDPSENRLWYLAMLLAAPVVAIVTVATAGFSMLFTKSGAAETLKPKDITRIKRIKPPPPPQAVQKPPQIKKIKIVPIPDPTPDEPEPIVPPEPEVEIPKELEDFSFIGDIPEAPPEITEGPVHIGVNVQGEPPVAIHKVDPVYPEASRRMRQEGVVILEIIVRKDGTVGDIKVLRSLNPILDQAAVDAASQWRFKPGKVNGRPVDAYFILTVRFNLAQAG